MTLNTIYHEPLFSLNVQVVRSQLMVSQFTSFILPSFRGFVPKTCICICSNFMHWWADCDKIYQELNNQGNESSPSPSQQAAALKYYLSGISIHVNLFFVVFFFTFVTWLLYALGFRWEHIMPLMCLFAFDLSSVTMPSPLILYTPYSACSSSSSMILLQSSRLAMASCSEVPLHTWSPPDPCH